MPILAKFVVFIFPNFWSFFRIFRKIWPNIRKNGQKFGKMAKIRKKYPKFVKFSDKIRKNRQEFGKIKTTNFAKIGI